MTTLVGKILVIVIMAFSFLFLGISAVVLTTHPDWRGETRKEKEKIAEAQKRLGETTTAVEGAKKERDAAKGNRDAARKQAEEKVATLENEVKKAQDEIAKAQTELESASTETRKTLEKATAVKADADQLRAKKLEVQKLAADYRARQRELNDQIRVLSRERDVAKENNRDLRERSRPSS